MGAEQWLKLDAYFLGKPFTMKLLDQFGPAGVVTWIAFLTACKRNSIQGRITYGSEVEARHELLIYDLPLLDAHGSPWTLDDFFTFTGKTKQTRKNVHGRVKNVICTHWGRWQDAQKTADGRERQRRSRAKTMRDTRVTESEQACDRRVTESEKEKESESESVGVTSASSLRADATPAPETAAAANGHGPALSETERAARARSARSALRGQP